MHRIALLPVVLALLATPFARAEIVVEPDSFAPGADLSNVVPGVTFSTVDSNHGVASVFAVAPALPSWASTGGLVFGHVDPFREQWVTATTLEFQYGALRADFSGGASRVEIDVVGNDTFGDVGVLRAYNAADALLAQVQSSNLGNGVAERLVIDGAGPIAYVIAGGLGTDTVGLDNFAFVPEPSTAGLLLLAGAVARMRRRSGV